LPDPANHLDGGTELSGNALADDLLDSASQCLDVLRQGLDGARLVPDDDVAHAPQAVALLSRSVFLCEAAVDLRRTERRSAAGVLLRPAIECWIDCCYVLYCKYEAVLQLVALGLHQRVKLAKVWLGDAPLQELVEQLDELDEVVSLGKESGMLSEGFKTRTSMSVQDRLKAAITCRGAAPSYANVYDYLYRGISTSDIHSTVAMDFHATFSEDEAVFRVSPSEPFDVTVLIALTTRFACGAGHDVFDLLGVDSAPLEELTDALDQKLADRMGVLDSELEASSAPEVQRALEEVRRRTGSVTVPEGQESPVEGSS
jgi:hypothetical protein